MVIWMLETLNWKQTNSIMLAGVASLGLCNYTELPNNIYQYSAVNMGSSIIERYNTNSSFLNSENVCVDLFDVIMAKYNINTEQIFKIRRLLDNTQISSLKMAIIDLASVISKYVAEVPKLTIFNDEGVFRFLVTISISEDVDRSLDKFDAISEEWFAKSSIEINEVLFFDIVA